MFDVELKIHTLLDLVPEGVIRRADLVSGDETIEAALLALAVHPKVREGDQMPTSKEICKALGFSHVTVLKSFGRMRDMGVYDISPGRPPSVALGGQAKAAAALVGTNALRAGLALQALREAGVDPADIQSFVAQVTHDRLGPGHFLAAAPALGQHIVSLVRLLTNRVDSATVSTTTAESL
jgi:DNA-binding transcriptional regulator YhcF (GntR family)